MAWMFFRDNDSQMYGAICQARGINQLPILFCSENKSGELSSPAWADQMIHDMTPFWTTHGNVTWICTHIEAEKFVTPAEVNRIAGLVRKYMPNVKVCVHATNTSYARCDVDAIAVQMQWSPVQGNSHTPDEVTKVLQGYLDAGAKQVICADYNWWSEQATAKAQGQAALKMTNCIGAWNGF